MELLLAAPAQDCMGDWVGLLVASGEPLACCLCIGEREGLNEDSEWSSSTDSWLRSSNERERGLVGESLSCSQ